MTTSKRIQKVLDVKTRQENQAHKELKHAQERKDAEAKKLDTLRTREEQALSDGESTVVVRASEIQTKRAFLRFLTREIEGQNERLDTVTTEENVKREALVERSKSKKIIQELKEQLVVQEQKEVERKEQRMIDILAQRIRAAL